jgi:hypothetical protein
MFFLFNFSIKYFQNKIKRPLKMINELINYSSYIRYVRLSPPRR